MPSLMFKAARRLLSLTAAPDMSLADEDCYVSFSKKYSMFWLMNVLSHSLIYNKRKMKRIKVTVMDEGLS